jgi:DNA-binding transcriptional ArsR family regulator
MNRGPVLRSDVDLIAHVLAALLTPLRVRLVDQLREGGKCVGDLREGVGIKFGNASQHLRVLRQQRLVANAHVKGTTQVRYKASRLVFKLIDLVDRHLHGVMRTPAAKASRKR